MPPHRHRFRVRYGETDQMGVVHHSAYVLYVEEGRTMMMRDLGLPYSELEASGVVLENVLIHDRDRDVLTRPDVGD